MKVVVAIFVFLVATVSTAFVGGADWPRFRGPNGQGAVASAVFDPEVLSEPPLWKVKLPGAGASSPIVDRDRVYVTSAVETRAGGPEKHAIAHLVFCYDTVRGALLWDYRVPSIPFKKHRLNTYASTTPVIDGDRLFFSIATPEEYTVFALDKRTGLALWKRQLGPFSSENGIGSSLTIAAGLVIVPNEQKEKEQAGEDCEILALDPATGETVWRLPRKVLQAPTSTPCVHNGELITTSSAHGVSGIDPKTGTERWSVRPMTLRVVSSPVLCDDLVFVSNGVGGAGREMIAVKIRDENAEVAYERRRDVVVPYVPTSVVGQTAAGKRLFMVGDFGDVVCLDPVTGTIVGTLHLDGVFYGSPIILGNVLLVVSFEGVLYALSVAETPKVLNHIELGQASKGTPAYADGRLFVRTDSGLIAFRLRR